MTQDKAKKTAARQRMAETGEPYSVARRAVQAEAGQIFVRYRLARTFELEVDEEVWAKADNQTRARLIADGAGHGSAQPGTTLSELIAHDLDERGADAFTAAGDRERDTAADRDWEEEYYADGAASEGISVEEFKAREASGQTQEWAQEQAEDARERAQERADQAQERADQAQERADQAQERADQAQEQSEEAQERADDARNDADETREVADDTGDDGDRAAWKRAERKAERAQEDAERAQEEADRAQARADHEQERAEREQERADREQERAGAGHAFAYHERRPGVPRPPRPPQPPRPPRPPRLPRLPWLPG